MSEPAGPLRVGRFNLSRNVGIEFASVKGAHTSGAASRSTCRVRVARANESRAPRFMAQVQMHTPTRFDYPPGLGRSGYLKFARRICFQSEFIVATNDNNSWLAH